MYKRYNPIGEEEIDAVNRVMKSGTLSSFIGTWCDDFHGGHEIKSFESELADYFGTNYAVTFNSLTSGLIAAIGAIGISPGDEVIVSPWTMSATATAIIIWGGIPVFVDVEPDFYGIDPEKVADKVTDRTKAIIVTNIFGHGSKLEELQEIAKLHNLKLIEDVAQAPGIKYKNKYCGTWGDIGGFSLNYHKHIHTGEGGFCLTNDEGLAIKMKLIRNHAESSVVGSPVTDLRNMVGFNFRMGEVEAAIGRCQLKRLDSLLKSNLTKADVINSILCQIKEFKLASIEEASSHAYYVLPIQITNLTPDKREKYVTKCSDLNVPGLMSGYVNVHQLPMYQQKIAFGGNYPWSVGNNGIKYNHGICPVAERLHESSFIGLLISMYELNTQECEFIANTMVEAWRTLK